MAPSTCRSPTPRSTRSSCPQQPRSSTRSMPSRWPIVASMPFVVGSRPNRLGIAAAATIPLSSRRVLFMGEERLDDQATARLASLLELGNPGAEWPMRIGSKKGSVTSMPGLIPPRAAGGSQSSTPSVSNAPCRARSKGSDAPSGHASASSACLSETTYGRDLRSLHSLTPSATPCTTPTSTPVWSLTNVDSRALYYSDGLGGRTGNWVDGTARRQTGADPDERKPSPCQGEGRGFESRLPLQITRWRWVSNLGATRAFPVGPARVPR